MITGKGKISDEVWNTEFMHSYINSGRPIFGYIGGTYRTLKSDILLERVLRKKKLTPEQISLWMTSTTGRHMTDDELTAKRINEYTKDAKQDVLIWSDPEHKGTLASSMKLRNKYKNC